MVNWVLGRSKKHGRWENNMPIFTSIAAAIVGALALEGAAAAFALAAINFGLRALATVIIASLIMRKSEQPGAQNGASAPTGTRVQLPPATNNKLPVSYGNAYLSPVIIDAKISNDQQYMWYVMALTEVTESGSINFDDPDNAGFPLAYWGDKKMNFNATTRYQVDSLTDSTGAVDTRVADCMNVYFYSDGSFNPLYGAPAADIVLSDDTTGGGIDSPYRWGLYDEMSKTAFAIVRIKYNQTANLTGLQQFTAYTRNTLTAPGDVLFDYLFSTRYGCAVPVDLINTTALDDLNVYSAETITYNNDGSPATQARYTINGPIDTTKDCLSNLIELTEACDSWLQWNEQIGQWSVVINQSYEQAGQTVDDLFVVYADTVMADTGSSTPADNFAYCTTGIDITPMDLNSTYNRVEVQFPSKLIKDQTDYAYINLPTELINPNEPINSLTIRLPQVNDSVQAQYIGTRRLGQSRDDLIVTLSTDYAGIQVDAGDIIRVYHKQYGWDETFNEGNGKLFRATQVQETKDESGNLGARLTLSEYSPNIYGDNDIDSFLPSPNTGITDPTLISTPDTPTTSGANTSAAIPSFQVTVTNPGSPVGTVNSLEFWYALSATAPIDMSLFKLYDTQQYSLGPSYPKTYSQTITVTGLPASGIGFSYYWRVRAVGSRSTSGFSANSAAFTWAPNPAVTVTGQNFQTTFQPNPVTVNQFGNGAPDLSNVTIQLYGLVGAGQVNYANVGSNGALANNEWRIDIANISNVGIDIGSPTDGGNYALWPAPTAVYANVATLTVPVIYKDNDGNVFAAPPSIVNINSLTQGADGTRGIVTLAYVSVAYNPTTANDATLSTSFFSTTGFTPPIDKDGAVFFNTSTNASSARVYSDSASPKWQFATLQVPGNVITSNSLVGNQIQANTISAVKLVRKTITADEIQSGTITTTELSAGNISANVLTVASITGTKIAPLTITANLIAANTITSDKLSANLVITNDIVSQNGNIGNFQSAGFWFQANTGNARIGNNLSVGNLITASALNANSITTENLLIGSVTQSISKQDDPAIALVPFLNTGNWPANTRGIVPSDGVSIIPTTSPTASANTEYQTGSRIQIGFTASISAEPANQEAYNLVELWRSGASTTYGKGGSSVRHSYNLTATSSSQTIHAVGYGGLDYYSTDGGATWSSLNNSSTTKVLNGQIPYYYVNSGTKFDTAVVGNLQVGDAGGTTLNSNWGHRYPGTGVPPTVGNIVLYSPINANSAYVYQSFNDIAVAPDSGGNGIYTGTANTSSGALMCGIGGTIYFNAGAGTGPGSPIAPYNNWLKESTSNIVNTLNSIYANPANVSKQYTAVCVGSTGTVLTNHRTWSASAAGTWSRITVNQIDTSPPIPLLNDLNCVAGNNAVPASGVWVAVGNNSTIISSTNDGDAWTQRVTPTADHLYGVRYGNGYWVAVGNSGTIYSSTDTITWTQINIGLVTNNLHSIDYSPVWNRWNITGDGIILTSAGTPNFSVASGGSSASFSATNFTWTRLWYQGSHGNVFDNSAAANVAKVLNNQYVSGTVIDTGYTQDQLTSYYLVLGSMSGANIWTGSPYLIVTEYKR